MTKLPFLSSSNITRQIKGVKTLLQKTPRKEQISCGFLIVFLCYLIYVSGFFALGQAIISLFLYSLITFLFYFLWKKLRKKPMLPFASYCILFLSKVGNIIFLLVVILSGFSYYENEISPANMPFYTISNGKKEVQFQAMIHIGTSNFYQMVKEEIRVAKSEGFVLFYEGVKPGSTGSEDKFNEALGIKFDKNLYKNFSKLYGLTFQDNSLFLDQINNYDFNVDLSLDEIVQLYEKEKNPNSKPPAGLPNSVQDINSLVVDDLATLNPRELKLLAYVNQAILNFLLKSDSLQNTILDEFGNPELFDVILRKRNELLSNEIMKSPYKKIIITYGLLHFKGIFEILKQHDPNWKIINVEEKYPIH